MRADNVKSKAMYGISRIDDDVNRTHAWRVSLCRRGKRHVKNFTDKKWAGKGRALQHAKQYRDGLLCEYPPLSRQEFCSILRRNNKSGIVGVYRYAKRFALRDGSIKETWYWEANWPIDKAGSSHLSFSVNEFGEKKARQLAIRARKAVLHTIDGYFWASERGAAD